MSSSADSSEYATLTPFKASTTLFDLLRECARKEEAIASRVGCAGDPCEDVENSRDQSLLKRIQQLLLKKASITITDTDGTSLLELAVRSNLLECTKALIAAKCDPGKTTTARVCVGACDAHPLTLLGLACSLNRPAIVKFLIQEKHMRTGVVVPEDDGHASASPALVASAYANVSLLKLLIECKIDALHDPEVARAACKANALASLEFLAELRAPLFHPTDRAFAPSLLHVAVESGSTDCVQFLIDRRVVPIDFVDRSLGCTAAQHLCGKRIVPRTHRSACLQALVMAGATVDKRVDGSKSPSCLMLAVSSPVFSDLRSWLTVRNYRDTFELLQSLVVVDDDK